MKNKTKQNKKTNKQTNKNKTTRRQKLDPTSMPLEIKIMMCAPKLKGWHHDLHIFFSNDIMAKLWSYLCWHGNKSKNKRKMLTVLYRFFKGRKMPIEKNQFPKLLTKVIGLTHRWNITVAKDIKIRSNVLNKIALSYGDTHIELTFLQLAIITSLK